MRVLAVGFWGTSHRILDLIGRGTTRLMPPTLSLSQDATFAMTGGAISGAILGAALGFFLSAEAHGLNTIEGTIIGSLLGISTGAGCGAIVQSIDDYIRIVLNSFNSK